LKSENKLPTFTNPVDFTAERFFCQAEEAVEIPFF